MTAVQEASVLVGKPTAPGTLERVARLWQYRNLLLNLVRRDLRIRYKESFLGFLWSLLNPMMYLAIFYVVFVIILHNGLPHFPVFLLSGLLPWTLFQNTLMGATNSVVGGAPLLKRVAFPREVLPLAVVGANIFQFFLQMLVLLGFLVVFRYHFVSPYLLLVIPALIVEILVLTGLSLMVSSVTVYLRDVAHFMELATLFWFWLTPVVYPPVMVYDHFVNHHLPFGLYLLNPMVVVVMAFQRAFYKTVTPTVKGGSVRVLIGGLHLGWYFQQLGILALASLVLVWIGFLVFGRGEGNFAEEL
jgi:ABC-2 type transport system permease protein